MELSLEHMNRELKASEESLRGERDFSNIALDSLPGIVYLFDREGRFLRWNKNFERVSGYSPREIGRMVPIDFFMGPDRELVRESIREVFARGAAEAEAGFISKNGEQSPYYFTGRRIQIEGKECLVGMGIDITDRKRAEEAMRKGEELLRLFIDHAPAALAMLGRQLRYISVSRRWMRDYGLGERDIRGLSHYEIFPELPERWKAVHRRALAGEVVHADADRFDRADGTVQWLRWEVRPWYDASGAIGGIVIFSEDITGRKQTEEALREKEFLLSESQRIANIGSWSYELPTGRLVWTPETYRIYGVSPDTFVPSVESFVGLIHPDDRATMKTWIDACLAGNKNNDLEFRVALPNGNVRFIHGRGGLQYDAGHRPIRMIGTAQDITERKKAEEMIHYQAYHNLLTGLPNRAQLMLLLRQEISQAGYHHSEFAVLHLDIDRLRIINESLGHAFGDKVIIAVAGRLKTLLRENDTLAHIGTDEFIIFMADLGRAEDAALLTRSIIGAMRKPFRIEDRELYSTASIGISMYPEDGTEADVLLKNADVAVSHAKERGGNTYQFFNPALNRRTVERLLLESSLRQAIERNELIAYYQPQMSIETGEIIAFEALVRWRHETLGILGPSKFIPIAEEIGFISSIDEWMLRTACAQARVWQESGYNPFRVSVNISTQQFQQPALVDTIRGILNETGLAPQYLEIEITEGTAMRDIDLAVPNLDGLHEIGVALSIDDFGTGYSSLNYLKRFPVHRLKIDQSFIRDIPIDPDDQAIVKAVIAMGHNLQLQVIAEGVETEEQLSFLRSNHCDEMQGYLYSEPLPPARIEELIVGGK